MRPFFFSRLTIALAVATSLQPLLVTEANARRGFSSKSGIVSMAGRGLAYGQTSHYPTLSRSELRQCLNDEKNINHKYSEVEAQQVTLEDDELQINLLEQQINREKPYIDTTSQHSVDKFNRLISEHRRLVNIYNRKLAPIQQKTQEVNFLIESFNSMCGNRMYYESDMNAILKELKSH